MFGNSSYTKINAIYSLLNAILYLMAIRESRDFLIRNSMVVYLILKADGWGLVWLKLSWPAYYWFHGLRVINMIFLMLWTVHIWRRGSYEQPQERSHSRSKPPSTFKPSRSDA